MLNHLTGTELTLSFETKIGGEFVLPDPGSLLLTIRDLSGVPLAGYNAKVLPDTSINTVRTVVDAATNTLPALKALEMRYAELFFTSLGQPGMVRTPYRLIKFMPVQVGPEEVRQALGVSYQELPDSDVDIFQSYITLSSVQTFADALMAGSRATIFANQILLYTEALRIAPSLRARILKQEEKDNALYTRFLMDFEALKAELAAALKAAEDALGIELGTAEAVGVTILIVTAPTDAVTGV